MPRTFVNIDMVDNNETAKILIQKYFSTDYGFGKNTHRAVNLLSDVFKILDEFEIDYFIISGTLLGYVRHNGFIPWDDDIDIIVEKKFVDKIDEIKKKYNNLNLHEEYVDMFKFSYPIANTNVINNEISIKPYGWPFVDIFIFEKDNEYLHFFKKKWDIDQFYPKKLVEFVGINNVTIPSNPNYFLEKNHGPICLSHYVSSHWNHRTETSINLVCMVSIQKYNELVADIDTTNKKS